MKRKKPENSHLSPKIKDQETENLNGSDKDAEK